MKSILIKTSPHYNNNNNKGLSHFSQNVAFTGQKSGHGKKNFDFIFGFYASILPLGVDVMLNLFQKKVQYAARPARVICELAEQGRAGPSAAERGSARALGGSRRPAGPETARVNFEWRNFKIGEILQSRGY